jgi:predicted nucleic acid-binding protein
VTESPLYLDCCVVLNVYATRRLDEILEANRGAIASSFVVAESVTKESMYVRNREGEGEEREALDLQPSLNNGVLALERLESESEMTTFVSLAATLDDGEAETGALAFHRNGAVSTDDVAAIKTFGLLSPPLRIVRTSHLLRGWAETGLAAHAVVRQALHDIRDRARFVPNVSDPLHKWWHKVAD